MLSKLHRGGALGADEIEWRAVGAPLAPAPSFPRPAETAMLVPAEAEVEQTKKQLDALRQHSEVQAREAFQKGVQQGEASARQQLAARTDEALKTLAATVAELAGLRRHYRASAEQDVVKLSLAIARRILHRELNMDETAILGLAKAALAMIDARELHRVRVYPGHADVVRRQLEALGVPQKCEVVPDPSLAPGGAVFETSHGTLDASVETQFEEIERGFADLVRRTP